MHHKLKSAQDVGKDEPLGVGIEGVSALPKETISEFCSCTSCGHLVTLRRRVKVSLVSRRLGLATGPEPFGAYGLWKRGVAG